MKNRLKTTLSFLCLAALLLPTLGCDSASNPIAPNNSVLTVTATPTKIALRGESSTITISGFRPDGNPLSQGTIIFLSTTLGTLSATSVTADGSGRATVTLTGDGRAGAAEITASLATTSSGGGTDGGGGGGGVSNSVSVEIAEERPVLTITANPSTIPVLGRSTITVLARDDDGFSLGAGETVVLSSDLGSVPGEVQTDDGGRAVFTFRAGDEGGAGVVNAFLRNSDVVTATITIRDAVGDLTLQANPQSIERDDNGVNVTLEAFVVNARGNPQPNVNVTFNADRGTLSAGNDLTDNNGLATVTLNVDRADVSDLPANGTFQVTATAISEGETFSDVRLIRVLGAP